MSAPVIAFFNNKGGVGKTSLVYHLAWMFTELGLRVVASDLDPQANLTAAFLDDDRLEELWGSEEPAGTVYDCVQPLMRGLGDIAEARGEALHEVGEPSAEEVGEGPSLFGGATEERLVLLVGDLALSRFEDELSAVWPSCLEGNERAFRVTSAYWRIMQRLALKHRADVILVDLGPNLGASNRAALIASDYVVVPLAPDLFSLQGLRNLGPTLDNWREGWSDRLKKRPVTRDLELPPGQMQPVGYIVWQHVVRLDRPVKSYDRWIAQIPEVYRSAVLRESETCQDATEDDPHRLALLKHYRSLMPLAQEARKPMFRLKSADGALGAHHYAVQSAYKDFRRLARRIAAKVGIHLPGGAAREREEEPGPSARERS